MTPGNVMKKPTQNCREDSSSQPLCQCPICQSYDTKYCFSIKDYVYEISDEIFDIHQCKKCDFGWIFPYTGKEQLAKYYNSDFYQAYMDHATLLAYKSAVLQAKYNKMRHLQPGRMLDLGSMKGEFFYFLQQKGWKVEGVELDNNIPNLFHMPIHYGHFLEMDLPPASYDLVTMWAVLEHLPDLVSYINKCHYLLKIGGTLLCLVTNFDSKPGYYYRKDDFPRHVNFFTPSSIQEMLLRNSFSLGKLCCDRSIF